MHMYFILFAVYWFYSLYFYVFYFLVCGVFYVCTCYVLPLGVIIIMHTKSNYNQKQQVTRFTHTSSLRSCSNWFHCMT